ncbi:MAG: UDP-N-acetylmuramoyl-tripeptide--D-alanyl-D-alanine ligase [Deltaproteobacteria bacterium]|nr:UDP-N-acetylmuramoyl-tripeptide--D-alanyl-D-alanine ligase [Deltaproteobacteria bacterium]
MPLLDSRFVQEATRATVKGPRPEGEFTGVSTDSRQVAPGQLFVALAGPNFDGHDYVAQSLAGGAAAAVVRRGFTWPENPAACLFQVDDPLLALGDLAAAWRRGFQAPLVGLTGSNGKTTTKEMLAAILGRGGEILKNHGNFNNLIGLPLTLLQLASRHTASVLEMGMNAPGEIARLTQIAQPDVGLVTNVGPAHLGPLGSMEAVARAKGELYEGLAPGATAVVNLDDPFLAPWAGRLSQRVVSFGLTNPKAQVQGHDLSQLGGRSAFTLGLPGEDRRRVRLATPGRHNVANALAAAAAAWALGRPADEISAGLEEFTPVKGRLNLVWSVGGPLLVDDTYNANPASVAGGVEALKGVAAGRRLGLILGDMLELGEFAPRLHREAGRGAVEAGCQAVLALGPLAGEVAAGAREAGLPPERARACGNREELRLAAVEILDAGWAVLVKGSRGMAMEKVVDDLIWAEWEAV